MSAFLTLPRTMPDLLPGKAQPSCPSSNLVSPFCAPCTSSTSVPREFSSQQKFSSLWLMSHELGKEVLRPSMSPVRRFWWLSPLSFPNTTKVGSTLLPESSGRLSVDVPVGETVAEQVK